MAGTTAALQRPAVVGPTRRPDADAGNGISRHWRAQEHARRNPQADPSVARFRLGTCVAILRDEQAWLNKKALHAAHAHWLHRLHRAILAAGIAQARLPPSHAAAST